MKLNITETKMTKILGKKKKKDYPHQILTENTEPFLKIQELVLLSTF